MVVHLNALEVEETGVVAPVLEWPQGLMEHPLLHRAGVLPTVSELQPALAYHARLAHYVEPANPKMPSFRLSSLTEAIKPDT